MPKSTKPCFIQWFGENICQLQICTNVINVNITLFNMISQEVIPNINVLGAEMILGVLSNIDGTLIITQKRHMSIGDTIILQSLPHP